MNEIFKIIGVTKMLQNMSFHNSICFGMMLRFTLASLNGSSYRYLKQHNTNPHFLTDSVHFDVLATGTVYDARRLQSELIQQLQA